MTHTGRHIYSPAATVVFCHLFSHSQWTINFADSGRPSTLRSNYYIKRATSLATDGFYRRCTGWDVDYLAAGGRATNQPTNKLINFAADQARVERVAGAVDPMAKQPGHADSKGV